MRSPEMRKKRRLRSVCAPHRRAAGTSIGPKLSFSMRVPDIPAAMLLRQGEQQDFGALARGELERALVGLECVPRRKGPAADGDRAAGDMHAGLASPAARVTRVFRPAAQARI